jgi:hypothetical protein
MEDTQEDFVNLHEANVHRVQKPLNGEMDTNGWVLIALVIVVGILAIIIVNAGYAVNLPLVLR